MFLITWQLLLTDYSDLVSLYDNTTLDSWENTMWNEYTNIQNTCHKYIHWQLSCVQIKAQ